MIGDISMATNIYIITGYTDMRKSIDGLYALVMVNLMKSQTGLPYICFVADVQTVSKFYSVNPMAMSFYTNALMLMYKADFDGHAIPARQNPSHGSSWTG